MSNEGRGACERPEVSIIIPTLNEAGNIERLAERLRASLESSGIKCFEAIIVDDGSVDGTIEIASRIAEADSRFKVYVRRGERGLASAIFEGLRIARGDIAVVMDADLQHPPEDVPRLIEAVKAGAEIAVASRYSRGGGVEGWSRLRLIMSLGASVLAWILVPEARRTMDPMSGFFAVRRRAVRLSRPMNKSGFKALMELLASNPEASVADVPYVFRRRLRGESKLTWKVILDYLLQLLLLSSPLKFALVGAGGSIVNLAVLAASLSLGAPLDLAIIAGFEAGLLFNFAFHERFTFRARGLGGSPLARLAKYHLSSSIAIVAGYLTSRTLITVAGLHPLLSQATGILVGFTLNYILASRGVWAVRRRLRQPGKTSPYASSGPTIIAG